MQPCANHRAPALWLMGPPGHSKGRRRAEPEGGQRLLPARDLFAALYLQGYIARLAEQWQTVARSFADALQLAEDEEEFASLIADPVQLQQFVILLEESWTKLK